MDPAKSKQLLNEHFLTLAIFGFGLASFGLYFLIQPTDSVQQVLSENTEIPNTYYSEETKLTFSYPSDVTETSISEVEKDGGIIGRLQQSAFSNKSVLITIRAEDGLRESSKATGKTVLDSALNSLSTNYPDTYPNFLILENQKKIYDGRPGADIIFSYDNPGENKNKILQRLVIIETSNDQAVYISMQTLGDDFDEVNFNIFEFIATGIVFGSATINGPPHQAQ